MRERKEDRCVLEGIFGLKHVIFGFVESLFSKLLVGVIAVLEIYNSMKIKKQNRVVVGVVGL